jgi:hypothetical protein
MQPQPPCDGVCFPLESVMYRAEAQLGLDDGRRITAGGQTICG